MKVQVQFFAQFRKVTGTDRVELDLSDTATVGDVVAAAQNRFPILREYARSTLVAKGLEFADSSEQVREGDEISLMPPVMGG